MKKLLLCFSLLCSSVCFGQAVYVNGFSATAASPSDAPSTIDGHLSYGSWTTNGAAFTSYAGASGEALSMGSASATTTVWTLPLTLGTGYKMALTSFSFWNRASASGYTNWQLDINSTVIGSGTISGSGASTGTISISGAALTAVSNLTGAVNAHLTWSGGTHGGSGTGRIDNFTLNGTTSISGCSGTPAAGTAAAFATTICSGSTASLSLSGATTGTGISYQWQSSPDATTWTNVSGATNLTYISSALTANTYYKNITTCSNSGLSNTSNNVTITVSSAVTPSVSISASHSSTVCAGTVVTYTATPTNGGTTPLYQWKLAGSSISGATNFTYAYAPSNGNVISCVMTSTAACPSPSTATSSNITMTVNPLPAPTISGTTSIASGSSANITFTSASGDIVYYWDGAATLSTTLSGTTSVVSVSPTVTTTYSVTSAASAAGCSQPITGQYATVTITGAGTDTIPTRDDNMAMGNPSTATASTSDSNNYLMAKHQYTLSYNNSKGMANWVSWHLSTAWTGTEPRCECFTTDAALPAGYYAATTANYNSTGFDRGHLCPSADRNASDTDNAHTFLMTNITPQAPLMNQDTWGDLEDYSRSLLPGGKELYIIAGAYGSGGSGSSGGTTTSIASGHIKVPSHFYKIIVVLPVGATDVARVTKQTQVIAVIIPNTQAANDHPWQYYRVSVDSIESVTGYNFLSNVADTIQDVIEAIAPSPIAAWDLTGANSVSTFALTTADANLDTTSTLKNMTRGSTAGASSGANSFRTQGFKNEGISTANTDYFQTKIKAKSGYNVSLSGVSGVFNGTSTFYASPGVTSQFAYSLNGTTFTLIGSPVTSTSLSFDNTDLSTIPALQNVPDTITIYLRYYASGQTTTGGWGFYSSGSGVDGFTVSGNISAAGSKQSNDNESRNNVKISTGLQVAIYPNPATESMNVVFVADRPGSTAISITDITGKIVYKKDMGICSDGTVRIMLRDIPSGVYMTKVTSGSNVSVQRLLKR